MHFVCPPKAFRIPFVSFNCLSDVGCQRAWQLFSPTFAIRFKKIKSSMRSLFLSSKLALQSASAESLPHPFRLVSLPVITSESECQCVLVPLPVHQKGSVASSILPFSFSSKLKSLLFKLIFWKRAMIIEYIFSPNRSSKITDGRWQMCWEVHQFDDRSSIHQHAGEET